MATVGDLAGHAMTVMDEGGCGHSSGAGASSSGGGGGSDGHNPLDLLAGMDSGTGVTYMEVKKAKRILANRQSAQRSRLRKMQYRSELEHNINALQAEVEKLGPQLEVLRKRHAELTSLHQTLQHEVGGLQHETARKDALNCQLREELERLCTANVRPESSSGTCAPVALHGLQLPQQAPRMGADSSLGALYTGGMAALYEQPLPHLHPPPVAVAAPMGGEYADGLGSHSQAELPGLPVSAGDLWAPDGLMDPSAGLMPPLQGGLSGSLLKVEEPTPASGSELGGPLLLEGEFLGLQENAMRSEALEPLDLGDVAGGLDDAAPPGLELPGVHAEGL